MPPCNQEDVNKLAEDYSEACLKQPKTQSHKSLGFAYLYTPIVEAVCSRDKDGEFTLANVQKSYHKTGFVDCNKSVECMVETVLEYNVDNNLEEKTSSLFSVGRNLLTEMCGQEFVKEMEMNLWVLL